MEELLNRLDEKPKTGSVNLQDSDIEVVSKDTFINTTKSQKHTLAIVVGYVLSVLSVVLPLVALVNYDPENTVMAMLFIAGILCLSMEISLSVILQYYEDSKSILHGRIQLCICGFLLVILGIIIHPALALAGIIIPVFSIAYFLKREKSIE